MANPSTKYLLSYQQLMDTLLLLGVATAAIDHFPKNYPHKRDLRDTAKRLISDLVDMERRGDTPSTRDTETNPRSPDKPSEG